MWWWIIGCRAEPPVETPGEVVETGTPPAPSPTDSTPTPVSPTGDTGRPTTDTGPAPPPYDGTYLGTAVLTVRITPYDSPAVDIPVTCDLEAAVAEGATPPLSGVLACTGASVFLPGDLRGQWTDPSDVRGTLTIGLTGPGYAPVADGPWEGALVLDPKSGGASLTGSFSGSYRVAGTDIAWNGTLEAGR